VIPPNIITLGKWEDMQDVPPSNWMLLDADQLSAFWRRCSLSSDFWARYTSLFVPATTPPGMLPREAVEGTLSYLFNELFENCAKFSSGPIKTVTYKSWIFDEHMVFQMTNHIRPEAQQPFINTIQELLEGDPDELYFQKLEESFEQDSSGSGLGYLSLIKDYGIQFGFHFESKETNSVAVDVQASVNRKED
jgi:hypothetical protein